VSPEAAAEAAAEDAWGELLAELEKTLARAWEGALLEPWTPPAEMPPLPAALVPRALALLDGQAELRESVTAARAELARALARTRRSAHPARSSGQATPVYLDAVG
jgi:hypothetical protein